VIGTLAVDGWAVTFVEARGCCRNASERRGQLCKVATFRTLLYEGRKQVYALTSASVCD